MFRIFKKIADKKEAANPTANIKSVESVKKKEFTYGEKIKYYMRNNKIRYRGYTMIRDLKNRKILMEQVEEVLSILFNILIEEKKLDKIFKRTLSYICRLDNICIFRPLIEKYLEILKSEDLYYEEVKKIFMQNKII